MEARLLFIERGFFLFYIESLITRTCEEKLFKEILIFL
jgi:hypothetical protein